MSTKRGWKHMGGNNKHQEEPLAKKRKTANQTTKDPLAPGSSKQEVDTIWSVYAKQSKTDKDAPGWCGFYYHAARIAKAGTGFIFDELQKDWQEQQQDGKLSWNDCRELLFKQKRHLDRKYRSMMWHFSQGDKCERCEYWDKFYSAHLDSKNVQKGPYYNIFQASKPVPPTPIPEVTDEEMASIEIPNGSDQSS